MRLLLVEDDEVIATNLKTMLTRSAYAVDIAGSIAAAFQKLADETYDLLILDWMLPDGTGIDLAKKLRAQRLQLPILMLTAKSQIEDTVTGLNSGIDDYLTKPFAIEELLARIRALSRRKNIAVMGSVIRVADLSINTNSQRVSRGNLEVALSPKEFALLHYLAIHKNQAIDRLTLLSHAWDEQADLFSNTVDVHIRYLRKKIDEGFNPKLIHTVKGKGYMLCDH